MVEVGPMKPCRVIQIGVFFENWVFLENSMEVFFKTQIIFSEKTTQILLKPNESPLWMGWGASDACTPKVRHHVVHRVEPLLGWQISVGIGLQESVSCESFVHSSPHRPDKILRIRISGFKYTPVN